MHTVKHQTLHSHILRSSQFYTPCLVLANIPIKSQILTTYMFSQIYIFLKLHFYFAVLLVETDVMSSLHSVLGILKKYQCGKRETPLDTGVFESPVPEPNHWQA